MSGPINTGIGSAPSLDGAWFLVLGSWPFVLCPLTKNHHGCDGGAIRGRLKGLTRPLERERCRRQGLGVEEARLDQPHESWNVTHRIGAGQVARLMTLGAVRPLVRRNRHDAPRGMAAAERDHVADGGAEVPR